MEIRSSTASFEQAPRRRKLPAFGDPVGDMVPIDLVPSEIDRNPAGEIGGLRIGAGIGFEQHRLLVEAARPDADDGAAVAVMIVAELRELLAGDEESRLTVRQPLLGFREIKRGGAHAIEGVAHRLTNSRKTLG